MCEHLMGGVLTVVRVFSVVVMPAFAMLTVCCSITCGHSNSHEQ